MPHCAMQEGLKQLAQINAMDILTIHGISLDDNARSVLRVQPGCALG